MKGSRPSSAMPCSTPRLKVAERMPPPENATPNWRMRCASMKGCGGGVERLLPREQRLPPRPDVVDLDAQDTGEIARRIQWHKAPHQLSGAANPGCRRLSAGACRVRRDAHDPRAT